MAGRWLGSLVTPALSVCPNSPEFGEGKFCALLRLEGVLRSLAIMCSVILGGQSVYLRIQYRCYSACILLLPGGAQQQASPSYSGIATAGISHQVGRRRSVVSPAFFLPYSPECVEGEFCELRSRQGAVASCSFIAERIDPTSKRARRGGFQCASSPAS